MKTEKLHFLRLAKFVVCLAQVFISIRLPKWNTTKRINTVLVRLQAKLYGATFQELEHIHGCSSGRAW